MNERMCASSVAFFLCVSLTPSFPQGELEYSPSLFPKLALGILESLFYLLGCGQVAANARIDKRTQILRLDEERKDIIHHSWKYFPIYFLVS